ncbi:MAG: helix-turn-helix domain-containing protein [Acidimicrobiales bacterium]
MAIFIGQRILEERKRLGWEQVDVAQRLQAAVGQQTVSRWEKGGSRPRRAVVVELATLFGIDPAELLEAAGYTELADSPGAVQRPVRPRLTILPVWELAPEKFEELIADLGQSLRPDTFVSRFGTQGHKQYGVDIVAERDSRYVLTYQCKRHRDFGPQDVRDAVAEVTLDADAHVLVLSRRSASPAARKEMQAHPGWTLWDAQDISRAIRGLPLERSVRIVDTYFPGWRQAFLGVAEPGPWLTSDEFFRPVSASPIYNHDWTLVGRKQETSDLLFFVEDPAQRLALVVGRGGIGKSKLLKEVARLAAQNGNTAVRFLKPAAEFRPEHVDLLPNNQPVVVIIDDAHDRDDLAASVAELLRARTNLKVLLAMRPYGLDALSAELRQVGLRLGDVPRVNMSDLPRADAEALAIEALGPAWPRQLGQRLGYLTADCPLITVVAGVLIRRGQLDPACVDHEETIRKEVLGTFRDVLVADPIAGEPELRRAILDGIAALQPFRTADPAFQHSLERLTDRPYDRSVRHIRSLEDASVLLRRGDSLRIVPDLLADVILSEASFDEGSGAATGYIERAWGAAEGQAALHIFVNTSRIDWQVRHDYPGVARLNDSLWDAVDAATQEAGIVGRMNVMKLLQKVAYFEPQRTLALVRWVIDNPTDVVEDIDEPLLKTYPPTYNDVLEEVPAVAHAVSYNLAYLRETVEILWRLAATDTRETNRFPYHPIRVLLTLAEFGPAKPIEYTQVLIDAAEGWLDSDELAHHVASPFDVLEPILATEGSEDSSDGFAVHFRPFLLNPSAVQPFRDRVIRLALREIASADVERAARAVKAIAASLHFPVGLFGRQVSAEERAAWLPSFLSVLAMLKETINTATIDPAIAVAIRSSLHWHLVYSDLGTREAAHAVFESVRDSLEMRVAIALYDGWGRLLEGATTDYQEMDRRQQEEANALAHELVHAYSDDAIIELAAARLTAQRVVFREKVGNPGRFAWALVKARPSIGLAICARIERDPQSVLLSVLPVVIACLAEAQPDDVIAMVEALLETSDLAIRRSVAHSLGWNRAGRSTLLAGEFEILSGLIQDEDPGVRNLAVFAAQRLAFLHHEAEALSLISRVPFADAPAVAEEVFQTFSDQGPLRWSQLTDEEANAMLGQLLDCPSIEEYWIQEFLFQLSGEKPVQAVLLLMHRIERWETAESPLAYRPLPYHWSHPLQVRSSPDLLQILSDIRAWLSEKTDSWMRQDAGGRLFAVVAQDFNHPDVLSVLDDAMAMQTPQTMAALASILRQASGDFIFSNPEFVARVLNSAAPLGQDSVDRLASAMHGAVSSGAYSGTPGQPFPQDVEQRNRAREVAGGLTPGSVEQKFYLALQQSAEERMKWQADRDAQFIDGRDW